MTADKRIDVLTKLMAKFADITKSFVVGNFYSRPRNNRKLTSARYVEVGNSDVAQAFLKSMKTAPSLQIDGINFKAKAALTAINKNRNWFIRKAEELIKGEANFRDAKIEWKDRTIMSANCDEALFTQEKFNLVGSFGSKVKHLKLP